MYEQKSRAMSSYSQYKRNEKTRQLTAFASLFFPFVSFLRSYQ